MAIDHYVPAPASVWIDDDGICLGCFGIAECTYFRRRVCNACLGRPVRLPARDEMTQQRRNALEGAKKQRRLALEAGGTRTAADDDGDAE